MEVRMIRVQAANLLNPQELTATVTGPDGANTLMVFDGQFQAGFGAQGPAPGTWAQTLKETYSVLLGPVLTRRQFVQAVADASVSGLQLNQQAAAPAQFYYWVSSIDADWDDESGQVELRIEVSVTPGPNCNISIQNLAYHVTVLAQM
jgi:hypothetical protein